MKKILIVFLLSLLIASCNRDEIVESQLPVATNLHGYYILSEGTMSPGNAKLSFYSEGSDSFYTNIFRPGNLGLFPDGMIFYNSFLYILEQGNYGSAGKLYKVDTSGAVIQSLTLGLNPYSLTGLNNKLYISNGPGGYVTVVDASSLTVLKNIQSGVYPQEIASGGDKIFVCNMSLYGGDADSSISVIDCNSDSLIKKIYLKKDPSSICVGDNFMYVGCYSDTATIYKIDINSLNISYVYNVPNFGFDKDLSYDAANGFLYYISKTNDIVRLNLQTGDYYKLIPNQNPGTLYFYGYKYDSANRRHLICDARDFASSGKFFIYNFYGDAESVYTTGVAPRRIVIK